MAAVGEKLVPEGLCHPLFGSIPSRSSGCGGGLKKSSAPKTAATVEAVVPGDEFVVPEGKATMSPKVVDEFDDSFDMSFLTELDNMDAGVQEGEGGQLDEMIPLDEWFGGFGAEEPKKEAKSAPAVTDDHTVVNDAAEGDEAPVRSGEPEIFVCSKPGCGKTFRSPHALAGHQRMHTPQAEQLLKVRGTAMVDATCLLMDPQDDCEVPCGVCTCNVFGQELGISGSNSSLFFSQGKKRCRSEDQIEIPSLSFGDPLSPTSKMRRGLGAPVQGRKEFQQCCATALAMVGGKPQGGKPQAQLLAMVKAEPVVKKEYASPAQKVQAMFSAADLLM